MTQVRALGSDNTVVLLAEYVYDFRGMRIAKRKDTQITRYDLDESGRNLEIQEAQGSRTTAWIGQKPLAVQDSGGTSWYVTDHQGTTAMMTDENGKILWEDAANPFGIPAGSRGTVQSGVLFTGKIFDPDADMYYFNARWYNPETGRFASEDPARDGINWYAYVGNNPLKYTDPTGLRKKSGFWDKVKSGLKKIGDVFRNNRGGGDSSGADTSTSSSSGSDSSAPSDSDDNSSEGANKEPPDGINTARNNGKVTPPNHGSEDSRQAFTESSYGDIMDDLPGKPKKEDAKPTYFTQDQWTKERKFEKKFWETACAATSLLNELSERYTAETGKALSIDQAVEIMKNATKEDDDKKGFISSKNAYVSSWADAANKMWDSTGLDGEWSMRQSEGAGRHEIFFIDTRHGETGNHFINSSVDGGAFDVWDGSSVLRPMQDATADSFESRYNIPENTIPRSDRNRPDRLIFFNKE